MKFKTLAFLLLITQLSLYSQVRQNGLIIPKDFNTEFSCCVYAPKNGFSVYNKPNGNRIGTLSTKTKYKTKSEFDENLFFIDDQLKKDLVIDLKNLVEVGYEMLSLTFFERKNGFVRIADKSAEYWLKEKEITDTNFKVLDWQQFYFDMKHQLLGFYADEKGLDLKTAPSLNSKTIKTLKGDLFEIIPTDKTKGNWTKIKVKKYKKHPCVADFEEKENVEYEVKGWIEVIDTKGKPTLWFYSRGC